ncbi:type II secretion system (T2SS) protein F [Antricoccus suffuscus]|uniref:Type II secretion system (T2SS) protein F n=1 Tax=Antricoccus suffuscus TaxID=1629062 RepID=A0A2T1A3C3_9ACTN|nr:type II secretion system F family protein [Antricoccus suffuscus]PRZ43111.1 type II secretion system (T2SS) protein F [Antricoccus suffuscus]
MTGAVVLLACAVALWPLQRPAGRFGLRAPFRASAYPGRGAVAPSEVSTSPDQAAPSARPRIAIALLVFVLVLVISPSIGGVVGATLVAVGAFVVMHRSGLRQQRVDDRARIWQLPMVLDVAGLLLRSGSPPAGAVSAAAEVCGPSLLGDFRTISRLQEMGHDPDAAWRSRLADPVIGPVARSAIRSADSGATLAASWSQLASAARAERRVRAEVSARKAGVHALAPLGLCFLPAFVCLGVVPIVIGLAGDVFG